MSRRCSLTNAITARPPSLHQSYPASLVLCSLPTSLDRLRASRIRIGDAYSTSRNRLAKNQGISLVALKTCHVTRVGLRLRVFDRGLPMRRDRCCLPVCTHLGQGPTVTKFRSLTPFRVGQSVRTFHPRYLSVYASMLDFGGRSPKRSALWSLIPTLQNSILSLWLGATQAGFDSRLSSNHFQYARAPLGSPCLHSLDAMSSMMRDGIRVN